MELVVTLLRTTLFAQRCEALIIIIIQCTDQLWQVDRFWPSDSGRLDTCLISGRSDQK